MTVALVESGTALESMRSSDFDVYSAYGEVIDNSIQADASEIRVLIDYLTATRNNQREPINFVAFGDDGLGMEVETLHKCLQLGYSSRYNDRNGIGRFGVGATLAAINQCQKIEVYSKTKSMNDWYYTFIDLQEVNKKNMVSIPAPKRRNIPDNLKNLVQKNHGTLVIWSKYDRQPDDASDIKNEFMIWAGRTYRKKIWSGLDIWVNGQVVNAIDPLYLNNNKGRYPEDPVSTEFAPIEIEWPIPEEDIGQQGARKSKIIIKMSLLPEEFRPNKGAGNRDSNKEERLIDRNEGISIMRNDREVFYGHIPYWPGEPFMQIDRWWGCEISFHAELDREFTVKNIKRGAVPAKNLKKALKEQIEPTRKTAQEKVREVWNRETAAERVQNKDDLALDTGHSEAEQAVKKTKTPKNVIDQAKDPKKETEKFAQQWLRDVDEQQKAAWIAKFRSQPFTIVDEEWRGPEFFETIFFGGDSVLKYNMRHSFHIEIDKIVQKLVVSEDNNEAKRLKVLIDLLIMAYGKSEAMFESGMQMPVEKLVEQLRMNWGHYLNSYIETYNSEE